MPRDTYTLPYGQERQDTAAPGYYQRPDFEQQQQRLLFEPDFERAPMGEAARKAAEIGDAVWNLQEDETTINGALLDRMREEEHGYLTEAHETVTAPHPQESATPALGGITYEASEQLARTPDNPENLLRSGGVGARIKAAREKAIQLGRLSRDDFTRAA